MESLRPGDACLECLKAGQDHRLRLFDISLEEQLLKCSSRTCLWPHDDEVSSDKDEAPVKAPSSAALTGDDDEFIVQLLRQLDPPPDVEQKANLYLNTSPQFQPEVDMPSLQSLGDNSSDNEAEKTVIVKQEAAGPRLLIKTPKPTGILKTLKSQLNAKLAKHSSQRPSDNHNLRANPFSSPPKKASTRPRSLAAVQPLPETAPAMPDPPPVYNIVISIPELQKTNPFLDAIKRHAAEAATGLRTGASRGKRCKRTEPAGRGPSTQAVRTMLEHLESSVKANQKTE